MHIKEREKEGVFRDPPFALFPSSFAHLWPSHASLTKNTWPGGEVGTETPVPTMWPSFFFHFFFLNSSFSCLCCLG